MKIIGVNGIATHGEKNTDLLLGALRTRNHKVYDVKLKKRYWISARWGAKKDAKEVIAKFAEPGDVIVAHSFGCLRAFEAHKLVEFSQIFCFAPAMSHNAKWLYPDRVHCFHSAQDWWIKVGAALPCHPFGRAGNIGFKQEGVTNINVPCADHNDYFYGSHLDEGADYISEKVQGL